MSLVESGKKKIEWFSRHMPILNTIKKQFEKEQPFRGKKITICIHLEAKTAYFATVLKAGGAQVVATGCTRFPHRTMWWKVCGPMV